MLEYFRALGQGKNQMMVVAGVDRRSANSTATKQIRFARAMFDTYTFNHTNISTPVVIKNDIALLYLDQPFNFNDYVWPACLPPLSSNYPPPGSSCIARGWGSTS